MKYVPSNKKTNVVTINNILNNYWYIRIHYFIILFVK